MALLFGVPSDRDRASIEALADQIEADRDDQSTHLVTRRGWVGERST